VNRFFVLAQLTLVVLALEGCTSAVDVDEAGVSEQALADNAEEDRAALVDDLTKALPNRSREEILELLKSRGLFVVQISSIDKLTIVGATVRIEGNIEISLVDGFRAEAKATGTKSTLLTLAKGKYLFVTKDPKVAAQFTATMAAVVIGAETKERK